MQEPIYKRITIDKDPVIRYGKQIWEKLFDIRIQQKYIQSEEELRLFGLPTVGDSYLDAQMHNQLVDVMITINHMVEYYRKGITVRVSKHEDTKIIYEIIRDYLIAWNHKLLNGINIGVAPLDDLTLLDQFAASIYPHAKSHFKIEDINNKALQSFGASAVIGRNSFTNVPVEKVEENEKYESMAQILSERIIGRNRPIKTQETQAPILLKPKWNV
jgi:hypothetical protein